MGSWGDGILEDDTAADVQAVFDEALDGGADAEGATRQVLERFAEDLDDPNEGPVVWLALAALGLERGGAPEEVRRKALEVIDGGLGLERWREAGEEAVRARQRELQDLRAGLASRRRGGRAGPRMPRLELGECFAIPLPDGRTAYGQYVYEHHYWSNLVRVFDVITEGEEPLERLEGAGELFPPVFAALRKAVADGAWRRLGKLPVGEFRFPLFRVLRRGNLPPGVYHDWWIWDGEGTRHIGDLPAELRRLEYKALWSYPELEDRIATGRSWHDQLW